MRKLRNDGEPIDVTEALVALRRRLAKMPGLVALYLYGSYGTEHQTPLSDVDLAVLFRPDEVPGFKGQLELTGLATEILGQDDVSVTLLNQAPLAFQFKVVSSGRELLVADPIAHADFLEELLDRYGDFSVDYVAFLAEYDRSLREDMLHGGG